MVFLPILKYFADWFFFSFNSHKIF